MSREDPVCPHCGNPLAMRDHRSRIWKWYGGEKRRITVRRMFCSACDKLHIELPDVLVPHKHYGSEVIENVVDGVSTPDDLTTEDYPCEKTMERWKDWVAVNTPQIDGCLRSAGTRLLDLHESLLASTDSLLTRLREKGAGWLAVIEGLLYRVGGSFLTASRALVHAPDLSVCPAGTDVSSPHKEEIRYGNQTDTHHMAGKHRAAAVPDDRAAPGSGSG